MTRSFNFICPNIWMWPSSRAISANMPTGGAALPFSIFSMQSATIERPNLGYRQALASYLLAVEQLREAVGTRTLP